MIISIPLDKKDDIQVKPGQKVDFGTPLGHDTTVTEVKILLSEKLGLQPKKIFSYLKKFVGDEIKKGDLLAEKKGVFSIKKYLSEHEGIIKEVNHDQGYLVVKTTVVEGREKKAYFKGEVAEVEKDSLKLKVNKYKEFTIKEDAKNFGGPAVYIKSASDIDFNSDFENKIICVEAFSGLDQVKLEALGAAGFVTMAGLPESTGLAACRVKDPHDWEKILEANFPYCLIDGNNNTIYFYS